ncbi:MAG: hypothetical protein ACM3ML_39245 [Micromonosporaceae bacterium]
MDTPYPPYYGYELAVKGAKVGALTVSTPNIYSYYSELPDGSYAVMLVDADPSSSSTVSTSSLGITSSPATQYTYDSAHPAISSSSFPGSSVAVPAESIVVLTGARGTPPPPPTPTPTPTTSPTPTPASTPPVPAAAR